MNYEGIVRRIILLRSDELDDWGIEFLDGLLYTDNFDILTDAQKDKIIEINRKYIATG
jgi:hypothetical protein